MNKEIRNILDKIDGELTFFRITIDLPETDIRIQEIIEIQERVHELYFKNMDRSLDYKILLDEKRKDKRKKEVKREIIESLTFIHSKFYEN